jgi:hypothetical protein
MITALLSVIAVPAAYWLPGAAFAGLFEWRGVGRWTRALAPFAISLVISPALMVLPAAVISYKPTVWVLGGLSLGLLAAGHLLAASGKRPVLEFRSRAANPASRREKILASVLVCAVAVVAMIPRLHLILYGSRVASAGISDIYWHLSELTSIVRGGLPPAHSLFPDLPLVYYYWSWIYPAVMASLSPLGNSLMRLLNVHAAVNLLIFLGVLLFFLQSNLNTAKSRGFALIFLTVAGGFDFFISPSLFSHEWWQAASPALVSQVQIPSMLTTYMWVPQHVAGTMAFLLIVMLWRNVRGSLPVRGALAAVIAAFLFGTSSFVFISACVAALIWVWPYRRIVFSRRAVPTLLGMAVLFGVLAGPQVALAFTRHGAVRWGDFRLVLAEAATGTAYLRSVILDQILTLAAFPVAVSVLLAVEIGLPFVLYAVWFFRSAGRKVSPWRRFLAWYPLADLPAAFLLQVPNFGMRGMIPVQIVMTVAAAMVFEGACGAERTRLQRAILKYGFAVILIAQLFTPATEWLVVSRGALAQIFRSPGGILALPIPSTAFPDGDTHLIPAMRGLPHSLDYIYYVNEKLPLNALIVETGLPADYNRIHLMERMRLVDPAEVEAIPNGLRDLNLVDPARLDPWWDSLGPGPIWEKALRSEYVRRNHVPVYVLIHNGLLPELGKPIYGDDYAAIYFLNPQT